ncbi:MAG: 3-isopropylmalate dehydratase large subunit [Gemmatimonadetes bacterium]|nr:3-isopropylmalate dehydratase large subunit [Gemmatimonadota bacterium]
MTIIEKILAAHSGAERAQPGQIVEAELDLVICHEITTPPAIRMMEQIGVTRVWDADRVLVTPDHFVPNKDIQTAELTKRLRRWVAEQGIRNYFELGQHGIYAALAPEEGYIRPGMTVICGDSHTVTLGAFGCFAAGVGSTDVAAALATGHLWFRVPETMRIEVRGRLPRGVYSKDLVLHVISRIGVDGANYRAMEWGGEAIGHLSMEARMTLTNMAAEAGGKCGVIEPDDVTAEYVRARTDKPFTAYRSDRDTQYVERIEVDASALEPVVALPNLPSNGRFISEVEPTPIDQVYIGSCTNARLEDLREAARIFRGRRVASGVRTIVVPATSRIWREALAEGLLATFAEAGCVVSTATCGACLGGSMGVLGDGERCLSTTNRNFTGRMGHPGAQVYLASPATAAATAVTGRITDPRQFL